MSDAAAADVICSPAEGISEQARAGFGTGAGAVARHHGDTGAAPGGRTLERGRRGLPPVPCPYAARPVRFWNVGPSRPCGHGHRSHYPRLRMKAVLATKLTMGFEALRAGAPRILALDDPVIKKSHN